MNDLSHAPLHLSLDTLVLRGLDALSADPAGAEVPALAAMLEAVLANPVRDDAGCVRAGRAIGLSPVDTLFLRLVIGLETMPDIAVRLAALQEGEDAQRPNAALLARLARVLGTPCSAAEVLAGPLLSAQLVRPMPGRLPLALAPLAASDCVLAALGLPSPVTVPALPPAPRDPPQGYRDMALQLVRQLGDAPVCLALRGGLAGDMRLMARALAEATGRAPVLVPEALRDSPALGPALCLSHALAVEEVRAQPGQRVRLATLHPATGPRLALLGRDGGVEVPGWDVIDVALPPLRAEERQAIWQGTLGAGAARFDCPEGPGPAGLSALAARLAHAGDPGTTRRRAAGEEARAGIEPHGRLVPDHVPDAALIVSPRIRGELDILLARCRQRRAQGAALGPAFHARRQGTGVRALFSGTSGGGKTLAAAWLATRLDMPLFSVDLASVVSKYIGETEENLARVLDRAELSDVILLFDEADTLFGARTETRDSSDRYANNQTNYLLSRIECHQGIVLMTTNARQRIDSAFARRIDQVIDMPSPDARQRRALWQAHLGDAAEISGAELVRLANGADISGGHIRTIVSTARVMAGAEARAIAFGDIRRALVLHYRAIGRTPPSGLEGQA